MAHQTRKHYRPPATAEKPLRIVIVGGGTAGWMAAALMAHHWGVRAQVTVLESPDIGIIGVGEGSTPQFKAFFDKLGIAEADWMPGCNATYKAGIRFVGWSERPGYESYFHPFATALDSHTAPAFFFNARARRTGRDVWAHGDRFFVPQRLASEQLCPIPVDNFPFAIGYGYHFDATLVGRFLRDHATTKLGVTYLERTVTSVNLAEDGSIASLTCDNDEGFCADLFVDASGFRALLIQQALCEPFIPFADNLFNDRAVAIPTPRNEASGLSCETRSTALSAGWAWAIPLTNRTGNGYVYSSRYLSAEQAEAELRSHLGVGDESEARHLSMNVGRVARSWVKNCLAAGLSQGFIEPLEATALHIVQATVEGFMAAYDATLEQGGGESERDAFNERLNARYDGIRDYIVAHYRMNGRTDTPYWRDNAANQNLSNNLKAVMTAWFTGADMEAEIAQLGIGGYYGALSWHCLFAGYGQFPDDAKMVPPEAGLPLTDMAVIDDFISRCIRNFIDHADRITALSPANK
ncbi:MAG: tryptophan halogenase family protein [Sphingopyxis sp.]